MVRRFRARNGIGKAKFLCTRCERRSITGLPKPIPFPDKSVTSRPPETRMGKGKGQPEHWVATVRPGNILFELDGVPESVARESLRLAADKLPVRTKFLTRHHVRAA